jgi:hypothetical protein
LWHGGQAVVRFHPSLGIQCAAVAGHFSGGIALKKQTIPSFDAWEKVVPVSPLVDRDTLILERCQGKSVIHLGATDHPFAEEKAGRGALLHQKLAQTAKTLVGIDSARESIELLRRDFGITDILFHDLSTEVPAAVPPAEIVICADIIEHVNSPFALLEHCKSLCQPNGQIILTTINGLAAKAFLRNLMRREAVHPDHVAWYSLATLGSLASRLSLRVEQVAFFGYREKTFASKLLFNSIFKFFPQVSDGIAIVLSINSKADSC